MKLKGKNTEKTEYMTWLFSTLVFLTVFALTLLTPKYADDFAYSFSFATDQRIRSVADIFPSMAEHRILLNGRVVPHFLVQLFLMMPKAVFSLLNALQVVLMFHLTGKYLRSTESTKCILLFCGAFGIWVFTPSFGENALWLDGSVNYCWAMTVLMLFLDPYISAWFAMSCHQKTMPFLLHVLFAFAAGAWSENGSLAFLLLAVCLFLGVWRGNGKLPIRLLPGIFSAAAGYLFLMTAPATAGRSAPLDFSILMKNAQVILKATISHLSVLYMGYVILVILAIAFHARKDRIVFSILLFLTGLGALTGFVFAAYFVERHFFCTVFLTVFSCTILLDELVQVKKPAILYTLAGILSAVFLFRFSLGTVDILVSSQKEANREQIISRAISDGQKTVVLTNYFPSTGYALPFILDAPDNWVNVAVASYYGMDKVYGRNPDES